MNPTYSSNIANKTIRESLFNDRIEWTTLSCHWMKERVFDSCREVRLLMSSLISPCCLFTQPSNNVSFVSLRTFYNTSYIHSEVPCDPKRQHGSSSYKNNELCEVSDERRSTHHWMAVSTKLDSNELSVFSWLLKCNKDIK